MANNLKTKRTYTVIEFSSRGIKLIQSTFKKQRIITKLSSQDNIEESEFGFVSALDKIIKIESVRMDNLLISLDRSLATIRFIKLPTTNFQEIENMAQWQAAKLLPYKIDELVASHQIIKVDKEGFSYVLLCIVPKNTIKKFIDICETLKLKPQDITLSSEGLAQWYSSFQSEKLIDEALVLVDIDREKAELVILYQDKFIFSRSFTLGDMQKDSQIKRKLVDEVRLSIDSYYKQETFLPIKKMVLTGDKDYILDLPTLFRVEFNLPIEVIDHLSKSNFDKKIKSSIIPKNYSFASIFGLALSKVLPQINLLPKEAKDRILYFKKRKELFKTVSLTVFAILIFLGIFGFNFYNKKKIIQVLDRQLQEIDPTAKEVENIKDKIAIINAQLSIEGSCIEILREIHRITPKDIYLTTLIFEEKNEVTIKGTAPTMSLVFSFVPILNESPLFENVQTRYATQRKMRTGELTDFEISCKLSKVIQSK